MKEIYEVPQIETIILDDDVVTMSNGGEGGGGSTPWSLTDTF